MSFCIELFCVVTLQYQMMVRIAIAYFIIEKRKLRHSLGRTSRSDFVQPCFVEVKGFDLPAVPSTEQINCVGVWIQLIGIADDRHETIKTFSHVSAAGDQVDL